VRCPQRTTVRWGQRTLHPLEGQRTLPSQKSPLPNSVFSPIQSANSTMETQPRNIEKAYSTTQIRSSNIEEAYSNIEKAYSAVDF
jgi:hypothetical protein